MDGQEFRKCGKELIDYIANYIENVGEKLVIPAVDPGFLRELLPEGAPNQPEKWPVIMKDIDDHIMNGTTHWHHPKFHAYFPSGNSYPSILAEMLSNAIGCVGFSWAASPACTELETIVLDWLGRMVGLPEDFLPFSDGGKAGAVIQSSASECILVCMLAARQAVIQKFVKKDPLMDETVFLSKLTAYCSREAHCSVEKAARVAFVNLRILDVDEEFVFRGTTLQEAVEKDLEDDLIPFFVSTTLGTTSVCSFDPLSELGPICEEHDIWLHVDAAYAGNAFVCEQFRYIMKGIEYASSFNLNPNKWLLVNFDCSCMWVRNRFKLTDAFTVDPLYLHHLHMNSEQSIDYRHWGIPLSRRFRSLKLWCVIRTYGISGLQKYILDHCSRAKQFETLVRRDMRFEVINEVVLGLVCFRLRGTNELTKMLLENINASGQIYMTPAEVSGVYIIRFCVCAPVVTEDEILESWDMILDAANFVLRVAPDSWKTAPSPVRRPSVQIVPRRSSSTFTLSGFDPGLKRNSLFTLESFKPKNKRNSVW